MTAAYPNYAVASRRKSSGISKYIASTVFFWAIGLNFLSPADANELTFGVVQDQHYVDVRSTTCLMVDPSRTIVNQKRFDVAQVAELVRAKFPQKSISIGSDRTACRSVFAVTVVSRTEPAIRYQGRAAQYLVSLGVCDWPAFDGTPNASRCLQKSVYFFDPSIGILDLLRVSIDALSLQQNDGAWHFSKRTFERI